jgi:hypothetical protein
VLSADRIKECGESWECVATRLFDELWGRQRCPSR